MKKDRNTFFSSANMSQSSYMPNMMPNAMPGAMPNNFAPYQEAQASQSFYAGPNPNANMYNNNNYDTSYSELDNRLAKIERQINRLDSRITRLENASNTSNVTNNITESNYSNSMYMV